MDSYIEDGTYEMVWNGYARARAPLPPTPRRHHHHPKKKYTLLSLNFCQYFRIDVYWWIRIHKPPQVH